MRRIKANSLNGLQIATAATQKLGFFGATPVVRSADYTVTNWVSDRTIDCNGLVTVIGDGLGTLIKDLIALGILGGTVSA